MSTTPKDDGGAAFPNITPDMSVVGSPGMTLRDYFAAAALQGELANPTCGGNAHKIIETCWQMADAMLSARKELARAALSKSQAPAAAGDRTTGEASAPSSPPTAKGET